MNICAEEGWGLMWGTLMNIRTGGRWVADLALRQLNLPSFFFDPPPSPGLLDLDLPENEGTFHLFSKG